MKVIVQNGNAILSHSVTHSCDRFVTEMHRRFSRYIYLINVLRRIYEYMSKAHQILQPLCEDHLSQPAPVRDGLVAVVGACLTPLATLLRNAHFVRGI